MTTRAALSLVAVLSVAAACRQQPEARIPDTASESPSGATRVDSTARDSTVLPAPEGSAPAGGARPGGRASQGAARGARRVDTAAGADTVVADTAVGIIAVVGSAPLVQIVLRPAGAASIALTGRPTEALRRLAGVEVWVSGTPGPPVPRPRPGRTIEVRDFRVRSVDGERATDGRLEADGGSLVLVTHDGRRHPLIDPPAALRSQVGARVWVAGPLDRPVTTFGVIEPAGAS